MTNYTLEYTDGRVNDIVADNDKDAIVAAMDRFADIAGGPVRSEDWDTRGCDGGRRMLIWESEAVAEGDDGSHAVAQLIAEE